MASGGMLGGVYEVGALRALEESIEGLDLNRLEVYVGVSAGAFVGAHLANGITVSELIHGLHSPQGEGVLFDPAIFFVPAFKEMRRRGLQFPWVAGDALIQFLTGPENPSFIGGLEGLGPSLPVCLFDNEPIRVYLHKTFSQPGKTDDFRKLSRKFFAVSTNLETGAAVVFGKKGLEHVPISRAVQASTAVPGIYQPVDVEGRVCVDGVLLKTLHASVALENGAELLLCVNPLVPMNTGSEDAREALGRRALQKGGLPAVLSQSFRILINSRVSLGMERAAQTHPGSDLMLFRPDPAEHRLFANLFRLHSRHKVCEIGYEQTRLDLWNRREVLGPTFEKHGLSLRLDVLADPTRSVWECLEIPRTGSMEPTTLADRLEAALQTLQASLV